MAAEKMDLATAEAKLPQTRAWVQDVMRRVRTVAATEPRDVLEIGAAQGRCLIALSELGYRAAGVEPWSPAIEVARELAVRHQTEIDVRSGRCEDLPFADRSFDVVLAFSVLEHVSDLGRALDEIARVLKPGGILWFNTANAMCPIQQEIRFFPLFGWYPDRLKRHIMRWCVHSWPAAVNHTEMPAMWWWTPNRARRWLSAARFDQVWDRWDLRALTSEPGTAAAALKTITTIPGGRLLGDIVVPGCAYAARRAIADD